MIVVLQVLRQTCKHLSPLHINQAASPPDGADARCLLLAHLAQLHGGGRQGQLVQIGIVASAHIAVLLDEGYGAADALVQRVGRALDAALLATLERALAAHGLHPIEGLLS